MRGLISKRAIGLVGAFVAVVPSLATELYRTMEQTGHSCVWSFQSQAWLAATLPDCGVVSIAQRSLLDWSDFQNEYRLLGFIWLAAPATLLGITIAISAKRNGEPIGVKWSLAWATTYYLLLCSGLFSYVIIAKDAAVELDELLTGEIAVELGIFGLSFVSVCALCTRLTRRWQ